MGDAMYKNLLKQWIANIQREDFIRYLKMNQLYTSEEEADTLYRFLKEDWEKLYDGNEETFLRLKKEVSEKTYQKLYTLYEEVKKKYHI